MFGAALLQIPPVCDLVFRLRFLYFILFRRSLRTHPDLGHVKRHEYSIGMLKRGKPSRRMLSLIRPLSVMDRVRKDARILSIGTRFETELLYLVGFGFDSRRIRGLDMIAYSPWVDLGNMHKMSYPDGSWDVVLAGWVLSYSESPREAAREIVRVTRDGGVVGVGVAYYPPETLPAHDRGRIQTVDALLGLFEGHVGDVYFRHDGVADREGVCCVLFSVRK